jgi:hypothetical protein
MCVDAFPLSFVIAPFSDILITVHMPKCTLSIGLVVLPLTFVFGTIRPYLNPIAVSHILLVTEPFSCVGRTIFKTILWSLFSLFLPVNSAFDILNMLLSILVSLNAYELAVKLFLSELSAGSVAAKPSLDLGDMFQF